MTKKRANNESNIRKRKDGRWEGYTLLAMIPKLASGSSRTSLAKHKLRLKRSWLSHNRRQPIWTQAAIQNRVAEMTENFMAQVM